MNVNDLLLWLSAKGAGAWSSYRAKVDEMIRIEELGNGNTEIDHDEDDGEEFPIYQRVRLNLECLGHVEFFRRDFPEGWRVVPPTLACRSGQNYAVGILCGARSDGLLDRITSYCSDLRIAVTVQDDCPDRIEIAAENQHQLQLLGYRAGIKVQSDAARMLLAAIPPIDDRQLRAPTELPFGDDWEVARFSVSTFEWKAAAADHARTASFGLYRFKLGYRPQYYAKLRGEAYKVPVQVGKYLFLRRARRHVISYNPAQQQVTMPVTCRPPILVDRALTLCEGLIPRIDGGRLTYQKVGEADASAAAALLRQ